MVSAPAPGNDKGPPQGASSRGAREAPRAPDAYGVLVGRDPELAELRAALEAALGGRGSLTILAGEAGIGKTHLADGLARIAADEGLAVHWGRGWEGGGAPAYWPWVQVLRSVLGTDGAPSWLDDRSKRYFALILPELETAPSTEEAPDPDQARFLLFDSVSRYLRRESEGRPILLILDDVHLFDTRSLELLELVAREQRSGAIAIVASLREPHPDPDESRMAILARIAREATTMYLRGLGPDDIRALLQVYATEPARDETVRRLHELTQGNPLFVSELIRLLSAGGGPIDDRALSRRAVAIPSGVRRAIRQRLSSVDAALFQTLRAAAVAGPAFDARVIAEVVGRRPEEIGDELDSAREARLLTPEPGDGWKWQFGHVLVREVLYEDVPSDERVGLHLKVGEALERHVLDAAEDALDQLAYHYAEAVHVGGAAKAFEYSAKAGDRAMTVFAYGDASARYEQALAILDLDPHTDPTDRGQLLLSLGNALNRAGSIERARSAFLAAADSARSIGSADQFAQAVLGFGRETLTSGVVDDQLVRLLEEALEMVGPEDARTRLSLLKRLCDELLYSEDVARRTELSREAVEIARRLGDPSALARALGAQALAGAGPDTVDQRLSAGMEMVRIGRQEKADEIAIDGLMLRIGALLETRDTSTADEELARYARLGERLKQPAHRWFATVIAAGRAVMSGRFQEAERLIEEARELGETLRGEEAHEYYVAQRFALLWEARRDEVVEIEDEVRRIAEEYPSLPAYRAMLLAIQAHRGRVALVQGGLTELGARGLATLPKNLGWLAAVALLAETAAAVDHVGAAEGLSPLLESYGDHNVVFDWSVASFGSAARYIGLLAETIGRPDDAVAHLERAVEQNLRMGALPQAARSQLDLSRLLVTRDRPGDRDRARELATQAREAFADLGMERDATFADHRLVELGGVPLSAASAGESAPALFRKEGEYWAIVYDTDTFRLKDAKGLAYLATLLAEPGREFHALDLFTGPSGPPSTPGREPDLEASFGEGAGPRLDPEAKAAYKRRLADLDEDLQEAEANNDPERAAKARSEREFLIRELAGAVGLGGRDRPTGSAAERARINVTKAIKTAIGRIDGHSPSLGHHLQRTIRTGMFCSYQPDPRSLVSWRT